MKRYMLDTDTASYLIRGDHAEIIQAFREHFRDSCISCITAAELYYGARKRNSKALTEKIAAFCSLIPIEEWNDETAKIYAKIRSELETAGTPAGNMDMLIAASAIANNMVLVTNNTAHFSRISGLATDNWTA